MQYFEFFRKLFVGCVKFNREKMNSLQIKNLSFLNRGPYCFSLNNRQICGISGASGSGKTLLLRAIADLESHSGEMWLDEIDSEKISGPEWRKKVAYLPAESHWWFETAGQHFFKRPSDEVLEKTGFSPEVMDWEISRLSTGEKQRLAVLRLLQNKPDVLLLDEPTASLDAKNISAVEFLIQDYVKQNNAGCVWVSHDPEQIARVACVHFEIFPGGEMRQLR